MKNVDVVIIGASCGGAAAGYTLAKSGKNVALIDKSTFPRNKLCGGMVTEKTIKLLHNIYGDFPHNEIIDTEYSSYGIYHKDYGKICKFTDDNRRLYFVERAVFDNFFYKKAADVGCSIYAGNKVVDVKNNSVILSTGEEIYSKIIIGADGAHSIVRKSISKQIRKDLYTYGLEIDLDYNEVSCFNDDVIYPKIYFGYVKRGYIWIFPKRNHISVGIGGPVYKIKESLLTILTRFLQQILKYDACQKHRIKGYPIPIHNVVAKPFKNNILLIGDAAGLIEPITGEGIYFAILSGRLAATSILNGNNYSIKYNESLHSDDFSTIKQGHIIRKFFYNPWVQRYAMYKMKHNAKYCKYYFDILAGEIDYIDYLKKTLGDRNKYKSE